MFSSLTRALLRPLTTRYRALASKKDIDNLYTQIAALLDVRNQVGAEIRLSPMRGWAISPDALAEVIHEIALRQDPTVIEFGSGTSTVAIAAVLRRLGGGCLHSFEHDHKYGEIIKQRIERLGLSQFVVFHWTTLTENKDSSGLSFRSYDLSNAPHEVDVALVDGPISSEHGLECRLGPMEWCLNHTRLGGTIFLDDANREGERRIIQILKDRYNAASFRYIPTEKGLARADLTNILAN